MSRNRMWAHHARAAGLASALLLPVGAPVFADCTPATGVHLNEIRYADMRAPEGGLARLDPQIELYNKSAVAIPLGGWKITDAQRNSRALLSGSLVLPAGAYLEVVLGSGPDDLDFSDNVGTVYTDGDSVAQFVRQGDAVALYDNTGAIQDFVSWASGGSLPTGPAVTDAVTAGIWSSGAVVVTSPDAFLFTIRLLPDGFDHDTPSDWVEAGWGESKYGIRTAGPNTLQVSPEDGIGLSPGPVTLAWDSVSVAMSYRVRVVTDPATVEFDSTLSATSTTVNLPSGVHRWSVRGMDACGEIGPEVFWSLLIFPSTVPGSAPESPARRAGGAHPAMVSDLPQIRLLGVPHFYQHKDTRLLCISSPDVRGDAPSWPGCAEAPGHQGPWDDAHPWDHAEHRDNYNQLIQCAHCNAYCARAANQMINAYFGGNLSQDRLSFAQEDLGDRDVPSPEGDLCGHGYSSSWNMVPQVLSWAILNSTVTGPFDKDYQSIRAEIAAGYPVRASYVGHAVVIDGFLDAFLLIPDCIHVLDPWPTQASGWFEFSKVPIAHWFRLRPSGNVPLAGRLQEASVTTDTDGDGVMDFDEGNTDFAGHGPRKFQSRGDRVDTDGDQVHDKQEIRSYTFHALDHPTHPVAHQADLNLIGPDPDHDGLRAELDPDSDNDGDFDGGEDKNGNGKSPESGETCVYYPSPSQIALVPDRASYLLNDPVTVAGYNFHAASSYTYYVYLGCPLTLSAGTPYAGYLSSGGVTTDGSGGFQVHLSGLGEGCYTVAIDVLGDGLYGDVIAVPGGGVVSEVLDKSVSFTVTSAAGVTTSVPRRLQLAIASNPSRAPIGFTIGLPEASTTRLAIYDVGGKLIRVLLDEWSRPGVISAQWDGRSAAGAPLGSGVYYARLKTAKGAITRDIILLR